MLKSKFQSCEGDRILDRKQLEAFQDWFELYAMSFYNEDPGIQSGIKLKEGHTRRVRENIVRIGRSLNLEARDIHLAETIALFHDVGRFKQFAQYRTFNDRRSENHALLGLRELERAGVLSALEEEERDLITKAIEYHNLCDLPQKVPDRCLLFARLIRDADKLDILEVFTGYYIRRNREPNPVLESGLPDTPGYSPVLIENLLQYQRCSYNDMKNFNDRKLLLLSWIYDINFPNTLSEIARNGFIKKIIDSLPGTKDIQMVHDHLQAYVVRQQALSKSENTKE